MPARVRRGRLSEVVRGRGSGEPRDHIELNSCNHLTSREGELRILRPGGLPRPFSAPPVGNTCGGGSPVLTEGARTGERHTPHKVDCRAAFGDKPAPRLSTTSCARRSPESANQNNVATPSSTPVETHHRRTRLVYLVDGDDVVTLQAGITTADRPSDIVGHNPRLPCTDRPGPTEPGTA